MHKPTPHTAHHEYHWIHHECESRLHVHGCFFLQDSAVCLPLYAYVSVGFLHHFLPKNYQSHSAYSAFELVLFQGLTELLKKRHHLLLHWFVLNKNHSIMQLLKLFYHVHTQTSLHHLKKKSNLNVWVILDRKCQDRAWNSLY